MATRPANASPLSSHRPASAPAPTTTRPCWWRASRTPPDHSPRRVHFNDNGIAYFRPWLFLITDGAPTDSPEIWQSAARRATQADRDKKVAFFTVGVSGADLGVLAQFSERRPNQLSGLNFKEMFVWLSRSTQAVAHSQPGDQVALDPAKDWVV